MAYVKFHQIDGGYRVHTSDGSVEPGVYVSYQAAVCRARDLNVLTAPVAEAGRPRRRRLRMRRTR